MVPVKVPEIGESITEGVLVAWQVQDGDQVKRDDPLFELETDKITVVVNAEESGRIQLKAQVDETVQVGQVVAEIDSAAAPPAEPESSRPPQSPQEDSAPPSPAPPSDVAEVASGSAETAGNRQDRAPDSRDGSQDTPASAKDEMSQDSKREHHMPPSVRRLLRRHGLVPDQVAGDSDRITRSDVMRHLDQSASGRARSVGQDQPSRQTRRRMSPLRRRIAQRLTEVQKEAAILTTFNEADLSRLLNWRSRHKQAFEDKHGVRLGLMSFFVKAAVNALQTVPEVNRQIDGDDIIENHYYDIGIAVSSDKGLVVPVLRNADRLSFAQIEEGIADLAHRARQRTLAIDDLTGGVFTISNGGVFGSLLSTPILNPPQSGVLGLHGIKKRPVAIDDQTVIRPMMYLALSYDHRIVDGREGVTFLKRVVECVENPERLMLEV